jgi:sporulation protein YlmC with PRC-barrel domain
MLRTKKISQTYNMPVYTDEGEYFGEIEESLISNNKLFGWKIKATKNSFLTKVLGSAKGVIVPHQYVKSVGDILIINKVAVPNYSPEDDDQKE